MHNLAGIYIGPIEALRGQHALLRQEEPDFLLAQFDDMNLSHPETGEELWHHWHKFRLEEFRLDDRPTVVEDEKC